MKRPNQRRVSWVTAFSLCPETKAILENVPNKSRFVREAIKAHEKPVQNQHIQAIGQGSARLCNPYHVRGLCSICWPDGPPSMTGWEKYLSDTRLGREARKPPSAHVEAVTTHGRPKGKPQYQPFTVLGWLLAVIASGIAVGLAYL